MADPIKATWCLNDNLGDKLTPWLIKKITGQLPIHLDPKENNGPKLLGVGSVLNWIRSQETIVWGSGIADEHDIINFADFRLVRGPICSDKIKEKFNKIIPYGDPGLIVPKFIPNRESQIGKIGILPHYIDQNIAWKKLLNKDNIIFINILSTVEEVCDDICKCKFVFCSSLHGLILCDAFGISNILIKLSDNILGDGTKYRDYFMSVNREFKYMDCRGTDIPISNTDSLISLFRIDKQRIDQLKENIWQTCPFKDGILR